MKTTDEILATWETEGYYTDWYAIDSYDPIKREEHRLFVGELDDVVATMTNYYETPATISGAKFYRSSLISAEDAKAYFERLAEPEVDELLVKCVEVVARKYEIYRDFCKAGNFSMSESYFDAYTHCLMMTQEITGASNEEIRALIEKEIEKCSRTPF
jgi:hypothetical protein